MITCTWIIIVAIALIGFVTQECGSKFAYQFPASQTEPNQDETKCDETIMVHAGDLRRVSWTHLNRDAAKACCNKRGMNLLSDKFGVTDDLLATYIVEQNAEKDKYFWTSGNDRNSPGSYSWENGHIIGTSKVYQWDSSTEEKIHSQCVLMEAKSEHLIHLFLANCSEEHPFICELEAKRTGEELTQEEMQMCDGVNYINLLNLPNLRWGKMTARFPLAKYCCEQKGWSIADDFVLNNLPKLENAFQDPYFQKETGLKYKFYVPHNAWVGYNDICSESKFVWNCGGEAFYEANKEWMPGAPNNEDGNEHCVHLGLRMSTRRLQINDIDCDFSGIFILCTTNATCPIDRQFKCPTKSKRKVYIDDHIQEDEHTCKNLTFTYAGKGNCSKYFLSDQSMTWSGMKSCVKRNKYNLVSFQTEEEIEFLARRFVASNSGEKPDILPEIWNGATNWKLTFDATIMWNGRKPIKEQHLIDFHNHDDIYPVCGKTGIHNGVTGVLTENCVRKLQFMYATPTPLNCSLALNETTKDKSDEDNGTGNKEVELENKVPSEELKNKTKQNFNYNFPEEVVYVTSDKPEEAVHVTSDKPEEAVYVTSNKPEEVVYVTSHKPVNGSYVLDENGTATTTEEYETIVEVTPPEENNIIQIFVYHNTSSDNHTHILCLGENLSKRYQDECPDSALTSNSNCPAVCNLSKEDSTEIGLQNNRLLSTGIQLAFARNKQGDHKPMHSFHLLHISTQIYIKMCPDVTPLLLQKAFYYFHDLQGVLSQGRTELLTRKEYKWIISILTQCLENATRLVFTTDDCFCPIFGAGSCSDFICTKPIYEFHICKSDPLVDVIWFVYELVHSACFPYFSQSIRMFHKYAMAIMDLWTKQIKLRWQIQIEQDKFWKRVLGPHYDKDLVKMQRCSKATISKSELAVRFPRHQLPNKIRLHGFVGY